MVVHTFHPSTQEAETEAGRFLCEFKARMAYREFQDSHGYIVRPFKYHW